MADFTERSKEEIEGIILAAINTIDFADCKSFTELSKKVTERSLSISSLLAENSLPSSVLSSTPLFGKITKLEFEEKSQRFIISFVASNSDNAEPETIRSNRADGPNGSIVKAMFTPDIVGKNATIYKTYEETKTKPVQKIRICPWIRVHKN